MTAHGCTHWIGSDTTGHRCGKGTHGTSRFCEKHYTLHLQRLQDRAEHQRARIAREEAAWRERNLYRLPVWRVQLERAEAEYARRTASAVPDRAAVGGDMHSSIVRAQRSVLSDTNVARVVELDRIITKLRADIARAEGEVGR